MKRKVLIIILIILIFIFLKLQYNIGINSFLIYQYNKEKYNINQGKLLTYANFIESYIANYNYGNILYQNGEYEDAIEQYKKALEEKVPEGKECNIRINYALAICETVQVDEKDEASVKNAIEIYESAIDVLTEDGCANKDDNNGHSKEAEQLKEDIQNEIDRLKELQKQEENSDDKDDEDEEKNDKENETADSSQTIEEKIKKIKETATKEQRDTEKIFRTTFNYSTSPEINW